MTTVTQEHLAGLELALAKLSNGYGEFNSELLKKLISQASAAPEQEAVPDVERWSVGWGGGSEVIEEVHPQGAYVLWEDYDALRAILAAAPHPVSGEQS